MSKKDDPELWHTSQEWDSGLKRLGATVERQNGSHRIYKLVNVILLVAIHPGDIPYPIRRKLAKAVRAAGVLATLAVIFRPHLIRLLGV